MIDLTTFIYLLVAEVSLIVGIGVILLIRNRAAHGNKSAPQFPIQASQHPEAAQEQYHLLVQNEINKAEARLHKMLENDSQDKEELAVIQFRMSFLTAEKKAIESHGHDEHALWRVFVNTLPQLMPSEQIPIEDEIADDVESIDPEEYRLLQRKLHASELRAENLTKFKTLFFELKDQFAESQRVNDALHEELEELLPDDFASEDIKAVLAKLRSENSSLHHQLEDVESSFAKLTRNLTSLTDGSIDTSGQPHTINETSAAINAGVQKIKDVMEQQDDKIRELSSMVVKLKLKVEQQQTLESKLNELQNNNEEFKRTMHSLEEENAFLCDQISALLKEEVNSENKHHKRVLQLESELTEKEMSLVEIESKYTKLESEFQKLYAEHKLLKGNDKASSAR